MGDPAVELVTDPVVQATGDARIAIPASLPPAWRDLLAAMTSQRPAERPSAAAAATALRRAPARAGPYRGRMQSGHVLIRFYGDLAVLAWGADRDGEARVPVGAPRSVKDAIEACGVPHTEIDLVIVDGRSVGFDHLLAAGARVAVYPPFHSLDVDDLSRVRPEPLPESRFVLDVHLGRLAQLLRVLGFDSLYRNDLDDDDLVALSLAGRRWLLTRDRGLLMRRSVTHGYLVRSQAPRTQVVEVTRRFGLAAALRPLSRCARCNGMLEPVAKTEVLHRLEPGTRREHDRFVRCSACGQLYWHGSHAAGLAAILADVRAAGP